MAVIHVIGVNQEDLHCLSVEGVELSELASVTFPVLKPWGFNRDTTANRNLKFDIVDQGEKDENAVFQTTFDVPHLEQNHFIFICRLPEDAVCIKRNTIEPVQELARWKAFGKSVSEFTLNNRCQSHVLLLEEDVDSLNFAAKVIGEQLAVDISVKPSTPPSESMLHLIHMVSYAFLKDRALNSILSELASLSSANHLINEQVIDLNHFLFSLSMLLDVEEALCNCKSATVKATQELLYTEEHLKAKIKTTENRIGKLTLDNELSLLQISQLHEELESLYSKMQQETKLKEHLSEANGENDSLRKQLRESNSKSDNLKKQLKEVNNKNGSLNKQLKEAKIKNDILNEKLASLQIHVDSLEEKLDGYGDEANRAILANQARDKQMAAERELSALQIAQLQEELEFYYSRYIDAQGTSLVNSRLSNQVLSIRLIENYLSH